MLAACFSLIHIMHALLLFHFSLIHITHALLLFHFFYFFCSTTEKWTSCPSLKVSGRNLTCIIDEGKNSVLFMGQYYFHLVVNNTKTLDSVSSMKQIMSTDIGNCIGLFSYSQNSDRNVHYR